MKNTPSASSFKDAIRERMARLRIFEDDIEESFARSSGPGGQNVNKVSTSVRLLHRPTGLAVTVQDSRSQALNRRLARERLLDAIERMRREKQEAKKSAAAKSRRQKSKRPRGLKERILETKKRRGAVKKWRGRVDSD
jgi:protein subunit release factor B